MGKFLKFVDADDKEVFVNLDKIRYFCRGYANGKKTTCLHMEEYNIDVVEAPEEVARKIEELSKKE